VAQTKKRSPVIVAVGASVLATLVVVFCCAVPLVTCPSCKGEYQFQVPPPTDSDGSDHVFLCNQCKGSKSFTLWEKWTDSMVRPDVSRSLSAPPSPPTTPPDPETRRRFEKEGQSLVAEGMLDAALLKYAAAEGAMNPREYVRWRLAKTAVGVQRLAGGQVGIMHRNVKPLKEMGPWALRVLLDGLGDDLRSPRFPAEGLLSDWGQEAVPSLCEATRSKNPQMRGRAVSAMLSMGGSLYPKLPGRLKELWADPELDAGTKADVMQLYVMVAHEPIDKK